tara:strand:- start:397 stop:597 length:201 start_codon:yes stop_codon:yes gene_type:complete
MEPTGTPSKTVIKRRIEFRKLYTSNKRGIPRRFRLWLGGFKRNFRLYRMSSEVGLRLERTVEAKPT